MLIGLCQRHPFGSKFAVVKFERIQDVGWLEDLECLRVCLHLSICLFAYRYVYHYLLLADRLSFYISVCPFVCPSVYSSVGHVQKASRLFRHIWRNIDSDMAQRCR